MYNPCEIGDTVRCVQEFSWEECGINLEYGSVNTVKVIADNGNISFNGVDYWNTDRFELVKSKEKIMKKSDLRTGMRVVHGKHSRNSREICIVIKDLNKIMSPDGSWNYLSSYAEDLTMSGGVWDITEVYDCPDNKVLDFTVNSQPLLWKRETQTPEQKQLQEVMTKISELQEQANKLQGLINK